MLKERTRRLLALSFGILLVGLLSACSGAVPASLLAALPDNVELSNSGTEMAFQGVIQALDGNNWTVEGVSFNVNGDTQIKGDFATGDIVKVHLTLDAVSGTLVATEIEPSTDPQLDGTSTDQVGDSTLEATDDVQLTPSPDETPSAEDFEFVGVVNAMAAGTWTINDKTVTITDQTEIKDAIILGKTVKVEARVAIDGTISATQIKLATSEDFTTQGDSQDGEHDAIEVKVSGSVETYSDTSITVNGQVIALLPSTKIEGVLAMGAQVEVEATMGADGTLRAQSIEVKSDTSVAISTQRESDVETEDNSGSEEHHDGSGSDSESGSDSSHDGGGNHSDD